MATSSITVSPVLLDDGWKKNDTNFYRIRLTLGRKNKYIKTNVVVHRDQLGKNGKPKDIATRHKIEDAVRQIEESLIKIDGYALDGMTLDQVVSYLDNVQGGEFRLDIFSFADRIIESKTGSSRSCYSCAMQSFREFVRCSTFDIGKITSSLLRQWEQWLSQKYGHGARAVSSYTAALRYIHGQARAQYNNEEIGYIAIRNPYQFYKPPVQRQAPHRAIDIKVIKKMLRLRESLTGRERIGVDVFLISFSLMGMNCPDLYECAKPKKGVIVYNRTKTRGRRSDKAEMHVRIENQVKELHEEYAGKDRAFDFSDRYTSYQILGENVNDGLEKFRRRIKYEETITLYSARHTWASEAYRIGIDKGVINDCLCHVDKDMKVTDLYINKDWSVMWKANAKVIAHLFGSAGTQARK